MQRTRAKVIKKFEFTNLYNLHTSVRRKLWKMADQILKYNKSYKNKIHAITQKIKG